MSEQRGQFTMLIVDRSIVKVGRKWRSKWWTITCAGCSDRKRRKDGSCAVEQQIEKLATTPARK